MELIAKNLVPVTLARGRGAKLSLTAFISIFTTFVHQNICWCDSFNEPQKFYAIHITKKVFICVYDVTQSKSKINFLKIWFVKYNFDWNREITFNRMKNISNGKNTFGFLHFLSGFFHISHYQKNSRPLLCDFRSPHFVINLKTIFRQFISLDWLFASPNPNKWQGFE